MGHVQSWVFGPRLFAHLGASRLNTNICDGAAQAACAYLLGDSVGYDPEDIVHARLIVLWGINTLTTNLHQWKFVAEAKARGAHVVAIDPICTDTAARCDEHLAPLPGTDAALALGLMRTILDEGAVDREWVQTHTVGWPQLEERLGEWPVARAAEICALDEEAIRSLGRRIAHTRPTALRVGLGLQRTAGGGDATRAIMALPALTGDWRYVGGGALSQTVGHFPYNWSRYVAPAGMPAPPARIVNMSRLGDALTEIDDPPVMATIVWNYNPVASNPNQNRVLAGFESQGPVRGGDRASPDRYHRLRRPRAAGHISLRAPRHRRRLRPQLPGLERRRREAVRPEPVQRRDLPPAGVAGSVSTTRACWAPSPT